MKVTTLRLPSGATAAARQDGDAFVEVTGYADLGALLAAPGWKDIAAAADGARHPVQGADLAAVVPAPSKVVCVGLNYASHIKEMGRGLPAHPTLFAKFAETLTGPYDDIELPAADPAIDWEAELVVVIGKRARRVPEAEAAGYIAGYTAANDISMRTYQFRTKEWLQGKMWEASTPVGPVMVTPEELGADAAITTEVDGARMQTGSIGDLVFTPEYLVSYISEMITLNPGDLILTGTTGGVGRARTPEVYLTDGQTVTVAIEGIGQLRNVARAQAAGPAVPGVLPAGVDLAAASSGNA
ncbi:fumarylacetoacetate hydrolase family protein [Sinomonas sp. ASV486]|uniref:fumarylacetoacetate hydrolase family protein n=1 Tax=Sinomonas sp. ASV486 TaxID=3051170 RepID=UPI0027DD2000|nr:fumarylacetoacetate hydrolase family protein [Sinomonas sp. ASV486]MDQ4491177.1 fumarylacetoacetate hydrolase family protein [Sinomonas sp. ASV486]MDQ4491837.1 fumarylacetoacetate hydrolase family protein [Sinomonas sp. ASV486]MDQ4491995.1 fumarylacetoacetate hydrolase family protein [Sinomonas sp. ASV486]